MRRFIEEIKVSDPHIASKIIEALETKVEDKDRDDGSACIRAREPIYEIDMFDNIVEYDPCSNKRAEHSYVLLRIFVREDVR